MTAATFQKDKWEGQQLEPQENTLVLSPHHFTWGTLILTPPPCYSRLDFSAQAAPASWAEPPWPSLCTPSNASVGFPTLSPATQAPLQDAESKACSNASTRKKISAQQWKHSRQVAIISLQVKIISMFDSISNSPDTFPNSHKWRQTGCCCCYKGSGSPQNAGCTQVQLLGPTTIKIQKICNCKSFHKCTN